jgi:hypothetical protein
LTIRKTLLAAFLLASLLPSALLTFLAFRVAGDAMRGEIEQSLKDEAAVVSQNVDKMLFERLQNAEIWRRLEVSQDIQVKDVDKRLSKFLAELKAGYRDVYLELLCTDSEGRIVASSNPASIGGSKRPGESVASTQEGAAAVRLEALQLGPGDIAALPIRAEVPSLFNGGQIGQLYLLFNWEQIYRILDQAAQGRHDFALLDRDGRIIAASAGLRQKGLLLHQVPAAWAADGKRGIHTLNGAPCTTTRSSSATTIRRASSNSPVSAGPRSPSKTAATPTSRCARWRSCSCCCWR